jgi:LPXTG-motif cell wall-anchored protein
MDIEITVQGIFLGMCALIGVGLWLSSRRK